MATTKKASARMSDDAVVSATGRNWSQWFRLLDASGADKLDHKSIVRILSDGPGDGVGPWWRQMITVTYEKERGLRKTYERPDGYTINVSKTIPAPVGDLYCAWTDTKARKGWLPDPDLTISTATANKRVRARWGDGTSRLDVSFVPKGAAKTQVNVEHSRLPGERQATQRKSYWASALDSLAQCCASRDGAAPKTASRGGVAARKASREPARRKTTTSRASKAAARSR